MEIIVVVLFTAVAWCVSTLTGGLFDRESQLSKEQFDRVDAHKAAEAREAQEYEGFVAEQRARAAGALHTCPTVVAEGSPAPGVVS
jgi:cob(I)alamin adenosyltransferase